MKIWGMGCTFGENSQISQFVDSKRAIIGWNINDAPDLYAMLRDVEIGDIVYLKTFSIKGRAIIVKQIGKVINSLEIEDNLPCLGVEWIPKDSFVEFRMSLSDYPGVNNVYTNTLFREYHPGRTKKIQEEYNCLTKLKTIN